MKAWIKYRRSVYSTLSMASFIGLYLTVAAVEGEAVSIAGGLLCAALSLTLWVFFTWLAGGFRQQRGRSQWR